MSILDRLFGFSGKIVVVTGATGQLGTVLCQAFLDAGATVHGLDENPKNKLLNPKIDYSTVDIRKESAVSEALERVVERHGKIDVLVNNAGVSTFEPFEERPEESFDRVMDVNLKGTFFCIRNYAKLARTRKFGGTIVNIGSIYGVVSADERIYVDLARNSPEVYAATKAGVIQMSRYFATHLCKHGIRVNCVSPGGILNPESPQGPEFQRNYGFRCPMGRMAKTEEMVGAVFYLASDSASYTTGQNLVVDGGFSAW